MSVYRYINALSLDVVAGALVSTLFFAHLFNTKLPVEILIALGLAVWSVYTIDHLWDARRSNQSTGSFRHQLHRRHFKLLTVIASAALLAGGVMTGYLPAATRLVGLFLILTVMVYFLTVHLYHSRASYHKEILVALIYTCGIIAGPYSMAQGHFSFNILLVAIQFAALAYSNLLLFSYYEHEMDRQQNFSSLARSIGERNIKLLIRWILMAILLSAVVGLILFNKNKVVVESQWVIILMTIPLGTLLWYREYFKQQDRYRLLGDAIFLIPLFWL
ncbi:MAG: hypothetical protein DHS20C17_00570 [Cyclobacteriaceae bacterium]|nr:MAG: hypothetical protein DHS20C17_00570 [Cyclobacteriaceae bacterium]